MVGDSLLVLEVYEILISNKRFPESWDLKVTQNNLFDDDLFHTNQKFSINSKMKDDLTIPSKGYIGKSYQKINVKISKNNHPTSVY